MSRTREKADDIKSFRHSTRRTSNNPKFRKDDPTIQMAKRRN